MTWLRLDDAFAQHPKIIRLSKIQRWIWVEILCYCARFRTEGRVPAEVREVVPSADKNLLKRLVEVGLLDEDGDAWKVHDWDEYNPADPTAALRAKRYRDRNANRDGDRDATVTDDVTQTAPRARASTPVPVPSPKVSKSSSAVRQAGDDDDVAKALIRLSVDDAQEEAWLTAYRTDPGRIRSCLRTAQREATTNTGGYLAKLIANGSEPDTPTTNGNRTPEQKEADRRAHIESVEAMRREKGWI